MKPGTNDALIGMSFFLFCCSISLLHAWLTRECDCPKKKVCVEQVVPVKAEEPAEIIRI